MKKILCGLLHRWRTLLHRKRKAEIAVFMFHEVLEKGAQSCYGLSVDKEEFCVFLHLAKEQSRLEFCTLQDLADGKTGMAVTFDDVHENVVQNAVPYLLENKIPFTFFVTKNLVGETGYVTQEQLNVLKDEPLCTIGYHTKTHPLLRPLKKQEMKEECDATDFEKQLGVSCKFFAYPYGSVFAVSKKAKASVRKLGYTLAFSTLNSTTSRKGLQKNKYDIPRLNVTSQTKESVLAQLPKKHLEEEA